MSARFACAGCGQGECACPEPVQTGIAPPAPERVSHSSHPAGVSHG